MNLNLILLGLMSTAILPLRAQNTTNLPTSMYGIGELSASDGGRLSGMGNVGIALNRTGFPNTLNPAAITKMDTTCFTFDVGTAAAYARYSYLSDHSSSLTANPNRISLGFRAMPRWYIMLGAWAISSVPKRLSKECQPAASHRPSKVKEDSTAAIGPMPSG